MAVSLWQDPLQKRLAHSKHGTIWGAIVFISKRWMYFPSDGNVKGGSRYLREMRI